MIGIPQGEQTPPTFKEIISDCLAYWERRRPLYNLALVAATVTELSRLPDGWGLLLRARCLMLMIIAVALANLCYSCAYIPDLLIQQSDYREFWRQRRGWLFLAGCVLGALLASLSVNDILGLLW